MHHSLLDRFRGVYRGAALADAWGMDIFLRNRENGEGYRRGHERPLSRLDLLPPLPAWGKVAIATTHSLTTSPPFTLPPLSLLLGTPPQNPTDLAMGLTLATLPLVLLGHEVEERWRRSLQLAWKQWQVQGAIASFAEASAILLSAILREKDCDLTLLEPLLNDSQFAQTHPVFQQAVSLVQRALLEGRSLALLLQDLKTLPSVPSGLPSPIPFNLALYCFLSTPDHFELGLQRVAQIGHSPHLTSALIGIWAGCYGGTAGLPSQWLYSLEQAQGLQFLALFWGVQSLQALEQHATGLMQHWMGVYSPTPAMIEHLAIASPRIPRTPQN